MFGVFYVRGGVVLVENGVGYAIAGFEGAEDACDIFCMRNGLELRSIDLVCGWDQIEERLEHFMRSSPNFMK